MTMDEMWWNMPIRPKFGEHCPCGAELKKPSEWMHSVCDGCRVDSHRKSPKREPTPDFVDVPLPGLEDWGRP